MTTTKKYKYKRSVQQALQLSNQLIRLAEEADSNCDDDDYLLLWGLILDSAYEIRNQAKRWSMKIKAEADTWEEADPHVGICRLHPRSGV